MRDRIARCAGQALAWRETATRKRWAGDGGDLIIAHTHRRGQGDIAGICDRVAIIHHITHGGVGAIERSLSDAQRRLRIDRDGFAHIWRVRRAVADTGRVGNGSRIQISLGDRVCSGAGRGSTWREATCGQSRT